MLLQINNHNISNIILHSNNWRDLYKIINLQADELVQTPADYWIINVPGTNYVARISNSIEYNSVSAAFNKLYNPHDVT